MKLKFHVDKLYFLVYLVSKKAGSVAIMIRVLHKAFDILEYLAQDAGRRRKLKEISAQLKLNSATCAHILKTMVQRGYADQEKSRGGYMSGPMIYYLAKKDSYRADLAFVARPLMADLVKKVNETVQLAVLHGGKRSVIVQMEGDRDIQVNSGRLFLEDVYRTATGRMLLAHLDRKGLDDFIAREGLPGANWPEAGSRKKLEAALVGIKSQKVICRWPSPDIVGLASPIIEDGKVAAALGLFLPASRFKGAHKTALMREIPATAAAIGEHLDHKAVPDMR
jgi:DNA-binding IclR family transcriptional regulator